MEITDEKVFVDEGAVYADFFGEFADLEDLRRMNRFVQKHVHNGAKTFFVDLYQLSSISASGIANIFFIHNMLDREGKYIVFHHLNSKMRDFFNETGFASNLYLFENSRQ